MYCRDMNEDNLENYADSCPIEVKHNQHILNDMHGTNILKREAFSQEWHLELVGKIDWASRPSNAARARHLARWSMVFHAVVQEISCVTTIRSRRLKSNRRNTF